MHPPAAPHMHPPAAPHLVQVSEELDELLLLHRLHFALAAEAALVDAVFAQGELSAGVHRVACNREEGGVLGQRQGVAAAAAAACSGAVAAGGLVRRLRPTGGG
jgi:hypothetical protein